MKALVIASLLFFSLRAMSSEDLGENQKSPCPYADQGARVAKEKIVVETETAKDEDGSKAISK